MTGNCLLTVALRGLKPYAVTAVVDNNVSHCRAADTPLITNILYWYTRSGSLTLSLLLGFFKATGGLVSCRKCSIRVNCNGGHAVSLLQR